VHDVLVRQLAEQREEAEVDRLVGQPRVEATQAVGVVGADRAQVGGPAVPEDDVGLPVRGIVGYAVSHSARLPREARLRAGPRRAADGSRRDDVWRAGEP
jgi:hypothetical protein